MIIETKNKTINLVLKTRKIVDIANKMKSKNFEEGFFKTVRENDIDGMSKIIYSLAENDEGKNAFISSTEVFDFLDDYKAETGKSYEDIWKELTEVINEQNFFTKKRTKKELMEIISGPLSAIDMNELITESAKKAMSKIAEDQILSQA